MTDRRIGSGAPPACEPVQFADLTADGIHRCPQPGRALDAGADDCFSRPFYPDELVARVRALTRRQGEFVPDQLAAGDLLLDRRSFRLCCRDRWVRLGNREFQLIELLARHQGQFLSTEQLMDQIWGCSSGAEISVVWTNISYLRRRLKQIGSSARIILSRGRGYLLECP